MLVATIFTPWGLPIGAVPIGITLTGWFWPKKPAREHLDVLVAPGDPDPVAPEVRA